MYARTWTLDRLLQITRSPALRLQLQPEARGQRPPERAGCCCAPHSIRPHGAVPSQTFCTPRGIEFVGRGRARTPVLTSPRRRARMMACHNSSQPPLARRAFAFHCQLPWSTHAATQAHVVRATNNSVINKNLDQRPRIPVCVYSSIDPWACASDQPLIVHLDAGGSDDISIWPATHSPTASMCPR